MTSGTTIRPARLSEAAALSDLMRRTFVAANGHCSTPDNVAAFLDQVYTPGRQAQEIRDSDTLTLIVEQDGVWAGFAQLRWGTAPPAEVTLRPAVELGRIYLDAAFHGQGIAAVLVSHLLAAARVRRSRSVWLNVWQESEQAIRFYRKHGFQIVGRSIFHVGDDPKEDWVMTQALPAA
ncbi:ribosomal protein S18 acetylase RimI-like enzyme [Pseudoxanthomonas japonensis]|uniref:GNAT family N-acetyltransferase n=1 Tax=Pseudoxanthomonas japonensis TaxID=69284 RepID=UPI00285F26FB|nr:GNAT family N-acetyltransferase [Pseudoxanthomonas japonensis]MDR7067298.1 ribosomal protein S18 acetylase RimI-like enzyme [Pseudoxanthomonas japonensis]